jgi:hypothetical protein
MNDHHIAVLAPDRDILPFEPRLVIALNPIEEEKSVQTDIVLFTIRKDQPDFEVRSYVYFFASAYELKEILPLVARNARRKAVEMLHEYIGRKHSDWAVPLAQIRLVDGLPEFASWYSAALLACPWNLRESFYNLRDEIHSAQLIQLLDQAFEQTLICRIA